MSRSLILTNTSIGKDIYIPIATESFFVDFWQPIIKKYHLYYIDSIADLGYLINQENLIGLINDLKQFKEHLKQSNYPQEIIDDLDERVDFIFKSIGDEVNNKNIAGSVG